MCSFHHCDFRCTDNCRNNCLDDYCNCDHCSLHAGGNCICNDDAGNGIHPRSKADACQTCCDVIVVISGIIKPSEMEVLRMPSAHTCAHALDMTKHGFSFSLSKFVILDEAR